MKEKLISRKFWVTVIGALGVILSEVCGVNLPVDSLATLAAIIAAYVLGQSIVDSKNNKK